VKGEILKGEKGRLRNKRILITGGAGFIGSHIADRLVQAGNQVIVYDNLATGKKRFLSGSINELEFVRGDVLDFKKLSVAMQDVDFVFHMSANADVKDNLKEPTKCLHQNTVATSNVLEAMRENGVTGIAFASTGSVYGEPLIHPTPEDAPFPVQTSLYAASKLACEGMLQAYSAGYGFDSFIFRLVSLMGERYSHGCVFDFYKKLLNNPKKLEILGDGRQKKSYLYVKDAVEAMFKAVENSGEKVNIYNLGHEDYIEVTPIARIVCEELGLHEVDFSYTGGKRGWVGDSPFIHLDISKMKSLGWRPTLTIPECIRKTTNWLKDNRWALERG
jgi:UDP-glucose 4-epimerase